MFLRNYDNYMAMLMLGAATDSTSDQSNVHVRHSYTLGSSSEFSDGNITSKSTSGSITSVYAGCVDYYSEFITLPIALSKYSICMGTGNAPATYDDYRLSGDVISYNLALVKRTVVWDSENKKFKHAAIFTCTNTGESDVTISEWGIFRPLTNDGSMAYTYNNNDSWITLMFREVLDEPVTIAAGTTGTLTFSMDVPMPNHL